jgi:hypothetical protein
MPCGKNLIDYSGAILYIWRQLVNQNFSSEGEIKEVGTMVEFYQCSTGVEYLNFAVLFAGLPMFFRCSNSREMVTLRKQGN